MNFKPLSERIVIRRDEDVTEVNGIVISMSGEVQNRGTVLAVADDVRDIQVGDYVCFGKYDGSSQRIEGEDVIIMKENQIWAVLEND